MMVGRIVSFQDGNFSQAMFNFGVTVKSCYSPSYASPIPNFVQATVVECTRITTKVIKIYAMKPALLIAIGTARVPAPRIVFVVFVKALKNALLPTSSGDSSLIDLTCWPKRHFLMIFSRCFPDPLGAPLKLKISLESLLEESAL